MKYCADSWFILQAFEKNTLATSLLEETRVGKTRINIPIIVFVEVTKKLLQRGVPLRNIELFFAGVEGSDKVELVPLDKMIGLEAARISLSYHVPLIDALVAATTTLTGCDALLAEDSDYDLLVKRRYLKIKSF